MVPLPLFKLGALFVRHISKYGANYIKRQAHDHPKFRTIAARYGQHMHQFNLRMRVTLLRDPAAERRAREKAEAPTVKTEAQVKAEEEAKARGEEPPKHVPQEIKKRKFRPLSEEKAVDLFADFTGDFFTLAIAVGLLMWEFLRQSSKPDANSEKISALQAEVAEREKQIKELENAEKKSEERLSILELAMEDLKFSKQKRKTE